MNSTLFNLNALSNHLKTTGHRQMLLLSGSVSWAWSLCKEILKTPSTSICITNIKSPLDTYINSDKYTINTARPDKPNTLLGFNCSHAVIDCSEGFYPDAITAISGAIEPGGFLIVLCPSLNIWPHMADAFAKKRTPHGHTETPSSPNMIKRFISHCKINNALIIEQNIESGMSCEHSNTWLQQHLNAYKGKSNQSNKPLYDAPLPNEKSPNAVFDAQWSLPTTLTTDQSNILCNTIDSLKPRLQKDTFLEAALGARTEEFETENLYSDKHFHIIHADRGRGKSHLAGLIAKSLINMKIDNGINLYITGPNKLATSTAFKALNSQKPNAHTELIFVAPERVIETISEHDILFVEEAASIPLPLLVQWSMHIDTILFTTTTHGYEGTGKGFQIRFLNHLNTITDHIHQHTLLTPIRYANNDPVENLIFETFCLNTEPSGFSLNAKNHFDIQYQVIKQKDLNEQPLLLNALFSLLVQAHYQTRPSDLRDILDAPNFLIFAGFISHRRTRHLVSACLVSIEGDFKQTDHTLIKHIQSGTRRPKGHLIPQVLTLHMGQPKALYLKGARIVRIATLPNLQQKHYGSGLLKFIETHLANNRFDYMGSSYADTKSVNSFWKKNGFGLIRTGNKLDKSSGTRSKLVIKGISVAGKQLQQDCEMFYQSQTQTHTCFLDLNDTDKQLISLFIQYSGSYEAVKDILQRCENWGQFYKGTLPKKANQDFRKYVSDWTELN